MFDRNKPVFVLGSPDLVKLVTVKDFDHFTDHRTIQANGNVFEKNLLSLKGEKITFLNYNTMYFKFQSNPILKI